MKEQRRIGGKLQKFEDHGKITGREGVSKAQMVHLLTDLDLPTETPLEVERRDGKYHELLSDSDHELLSDSGNTELLNVFLLLGVILSQHGCPASWGHW